MKIENIKISQKLRLKHLTDEDINDINNSVGRVDGLDDYCGEVFNVIDIDKRCEILQFKMPNTEYGFWLQPCYFELTDEPTFNSLEIGDHFWAKIRNKIAVFIYHGKDDIQVCGGWEGDFKNSELELISKVEIPNGYTKEDLYY